MIKTQIKELTKNDLNPDLLKHFNRYQEVKRCVRMENGKWVLKDIPFIEEWDDALKKEIIAVDFNNCINTGGVVWAVYNEKNEVIAFACLLSDFFGSENQYFQLMQIHTSYEHRGRGIGKELFKLSADKAREMGAKKLYISTHSAEESQLFYEKIGCVDAQEINGKLAALEPYDRQMEFIL